MAPTTRPWRLPDGGVTDNPDEASDAWHAILDPVAKILKLDIIGYGNKGCASFGKLGDPHSATILIPLPLMKLLISLNEKAEKYDEMMSNREDREV